MHRASGAPLQRPLGWTPAWLTRAAAAAPAGPQDDYGVSWDRIGWLNPTVPLGAETIPRGTTVCLKNGPTPPGATVLEEPGALSFERGSSLTVAARAGCPSRLPAPCLLPLLLPLQRCPTGCRPGPT